MSEELERLYREAKRALKNRDQGGAIELLRQILLADENYRDASRLLAQAVKSGRRRWFNSLWLWGALGAALLVTIAVLLAPRIPSLYSPGVPTATSTQPPALLRAATATAALIPSPTSVPLTWERLNFGQFLPRDVVTAIAFDPLDAETIYVGMESAGIYKSINGGLSWQAMQNGLATASIQSLLVDPRTPTTVYAGTVQGGLYKTTDGAGTWNLITVQLPRRFHSNVAIDPADSGHLLYTTGGREIYESLDGGGSWQETPRQGPCPNNIASLIFDSKNSATLYATQSPKPGQSCFVGVYVSVDGGHNWASVGTDQPQLWPGTAPVYLAMDSAGNHLYAYHGDLNVSEDQGATWKRSPGFGCMPFALPADNPPTLYCVSGDVIWVSTNHGLNWNSAMRNTGSRIQTIGISQHGDGTVLFAASSGLWAADVNSGAIQERSSGLGTVRLALASAPGSPPALLLDTTLTCMYQSFDRGRSWEPLMSLPRRPCISQGVISGQSIYYSVEGQLFASSDGGATYRQWPMPLQSEELQTLYAHPVLAGKLFAIYAREEPPYVYTSEDGGRSWRASTDMGRLDNARLFVAPGDGERMYAVGIDGAYVSRDAGQTWQVCGEIGSLTASDLAIDPQNANELFLATRSEGILTSQNGCQTWRTSENLLRSLSVNSVGLDPQTPATIYAGTDGGAYVSYDAGQSWRQINDGLLGATVVYSVVVDRGGSVYAATPYGIFRLEHH